MIRVLVTGASGFVGSHLVESWDKSKFQIFGTVYGSDNSLENDLPPDQIIPLNLLDEEKVNAVVAQVKPQCVVHLAAFAAPGKSFQNPKVTLQNNIVGQTNLLHALIQLKTKPKTLVIGSAEEYGLISPQDLPINEATSLRPTSPYGVSKIAQDYLALQYYLAHELPVVRVRPFNHTGERQTEHFVVPAFAKQIAAIEAGLSEPVLKVGNLEAKRDFTDVKDMVAAYQSVLEDGESGEVYNLGSGTAVSIQTVLDTLLALSDADIQVEQEQDRMRPSDISELRADISKFQRISDWKPRIPLKETLTRVLHYWRQQTTTQN